MNKTMHEKKVKTWTNEELRCWIEGYWSAQDDKDGLVAKVAAEMNRRASIRRNR
jgi:hypothetical protein